jgi:SAM-dependent methyltransferase
MGRWSRLLATEVVRQLDPPVGQRWLDVGCGTGSASAAVLAGAAPASLVGIDPSAAYVAAAESRLGDESTTFQVGGADALPIPDASVDRIICGLVLNFVPDAVAAVREMRRVLVPGGAATAYVWDYAEGMQMLRVFWDAVIAEDPAAAELDEGARFAICRPRGLADVFGQAGFAPVTTGPVEIPMRFRDFDDYWLPFLGGQGPASGYCASLTEEARERLRARLETALPVSHDGSISLTARAWVATS